MKKALLSILIFIVLFTSSCGLKAQSEGEDMEDSIETQNYIEAFGIVKSRNVLNMTMPFTAMVESINVVEGQRLEENEIIMTLDLRDIDGKIKEKEIEINSLLVERSALKNQLEMEWDERPEALKFLNEKELAEQDLNHAIDDFKKQKRLFDAGGISEKEFVDFERKIELKEKGLDEILIEEEKARYEFEQSRLKTSTELKSLEYKIQIARSSASTLKDKRGCAFIKEASIVSTLENAMVYDIECRAGDILQEGEKFISLQDIDNLYIEANINEEFIKDISIGSEAVIFLDADKGYEYKGKVSFISQGAFEKYGQTVVPIHIEIENKDDFLKPNYNADIQILYK